MFLIARRQMEVGGINQELMYMSLKFVNNIWVLAKVKAQVKAVPGGASVGVSPSLCVVVVYIIMHLPCFKDRKCVGTGYYMEFSKCIYCSNSYCFSDGAMSVSLSLQLTLKTSIMAVVPGVQQAFHSILHN